LQLSLQEEIQEAPREVHKIGYDIVDVHLLTKDVVFVMINKLASSASALGCGWL
jgi:hypothetical protein